MEAVCSGSAATLGFLAVTSIDPPKLPIEHVTGEYETTCPAVGFLVVDDEVLISCTLGTLELVDRFRVRSFGLLVFGDSLAGA
jgi:hypothetical protein